MTQPGPGIKSADPTRIRPRDFFSGTPTPGLQTVEAGIESYKGYKATYVGTVWYGMEWYGMVWNSMERYGMVCYGLVWYSRAIFPICAAQQSGEAAAGAGEA